MTFCVLVAAENKMAASMQHRLQSPASLSGMKQQLSPVSCRHTRTHIAAPVGVQQQHHKRAPLQPVQALAAAHRQPLAPGQHKQQQQQLWQQQGQQQRRQRVLLVFAVDPAAEPASAADDDSDLDPNIPAVDQDFDLLGAEVRSHGGGGGRRCW